MHNIGDLVMCLGYLNGHVGKHINGFELVHEIYGMGQKN